MGLYLIWFIFLVVQKSFVLLFFVFHTFMTEPFVGVGKTSLLLVFQVIHPQPALSPPLG